MPVWTSSTTIRILCLVHKSRTPCKYLKYTFVRPTVSEKLQYECALYTHPVEGTTTPASPWIGSTMNAQMLGSLSNLACAKSRWKQEQACEHSIIWDMILWWHLQRFQVIVRNGIKSGHVWPESFESRRILQYNDRVNATPWWNYFGGTFSPFCLTVEDEIAPSVRPQKLFSAKITFAWPSAIPETNKYYWIIEHALELL